MFVVTLTHNGFNLYLRSTTTTDDAGRATKFDTVDAALAGIDKARKFNKPAVIKTAQIRAINIDLVAQADAELDATHATAFAAKMPLEEFRVTMIAAEAKRLAAHRSALS